MLARQIKPKVWILEDTIEIVELLRDTLESTYELQFISSLEQFSLACRKVKPSPDLLIADLELPDGNFMSVIHSELWKHSPITPFLVVSGETDLEKMRECFRAGAWDFITKPFHMNEVSLKVEQVLARPKESGLPPVQRTRPEFDIFQRLVTYHGQVSAPLTIRESEIFHTLLKSFGTAVHREEITQNIWGQKKVSSKSFDVHLWNLRRKLAALDLQISLISSSSYALAHLPQKIKN